MNATRWRKAKRARKFWRNTIVSLSGLDVHWIVALTEGLTGNRQQAGVELKDLSNEAEKQGNVGLAFKVRLALGQIALKSHDRIRPQDLERFVERCRRTGFPFWSQKRASATMNR